MGNSADRVRVAFDKVIELETPPLVQFAVSLMSSQDCLNIPEAMVNAEWRIGVLERIIDKLIATAPRGTVSAHDLEKWRAESLADIQKKYSAVNFTRTQRVHRPPISPF